ncbi:hypothetical protein E4T56_gene2869 [Termitomyces sp. T112]|nr:hypothetical protein E4T56_gene2869 [Termitomyces sp. T112]
MAPWPTSVPAPQPLTLTLGLPNPENHPHCSQSSPPHHQLNALTYSEVSRQPRGNPCSPMIPSTYQHGTILDHNRHLPPPSSSTKPCRHSRRTPKSSGISSQSPGLVSSPFRSRSCYRFVSLFESTLVPYQHHPISSDAVSVQTSLFARFRTPSAPNDLPSKPGSAPPDHTAASSFASANPPYGLLPEPRQDRLVSSQSDFSGPPPTSLDLPGSVWITSPQLPAQATMARNVFECSVTSARGSRPPSKDLPSAAEPPSLPPVLASTPPIAEAEEPNDDEAAQPKEDESKMDCATAVATAVNQSTIADDCSHQQLHCYCDQLWPAASITNSAIATDSVTPTRPTASITNSAIATGPAASNEFTVPTSVESVLTSPIAATGQLMDVDMTGPAPSHAPDEIVPQCGCSTS